MTGDLFSDHAPSPGSAPDNRRLIGPYARQELADYRIKFWFALTRHAAGTRRYELACTKGDRRPLARFRGDESDTSLRKFLLPADLSAYPAAPYPRHKGDRLERAMLAMLTGDDLADAIRIMRFGIMPVR